MIRLRELTINADENVYLMLQKIGKEENGFHNDVNGMTFYQFREWLIQQKKWENGESLPVGYVRQWIFWLYDGDTPVGMGKLREKLTDSSRQKGGNIGYAITPDQRGKGYGSILFMLLLEKAKELSISEVISTVEKKNPASKRVQEKCGGVLVSENDERWFFSFNDIVKT